ncbi:MAG: 3-dehydroquinate synthase [Clostridia bacterium]|nr:3-dehydroquinate synthase [Clostridia bacterium]
MERIPVILEERSYEVLLDDGIAARPGKAVREVVPGRAVALVTDDHVAPLYLDHAEQSLQKAGFRTESLVLPHGEAAKSFASLEKVYDFLARARITREDAVLALGGGVIGDLAGFAAATWLRGVRLIQVPTSLLAQVDASVGGKTAVDLPAGKNLVGAFWQPSLVLCDPQVLQTLPDRDWRSGLGEVVKYACIRDTKLFDRLERLAPGGRAALAAEAGPLAARCIRMKALFVAADEHDTGERQLLNFGHTLGHAIECCEHYRGHSHGEAVAIGMAEITRRSEAAGQTVPGTAARLTNLLKALGLPDQLPDIPRARLLEAVASDKKQGAEGLRCVLLRKIGSARLQSVEPGWLLPG